MRVVDGEARLIGARCASCGHGTFPRRDRCPACRASRPLQESMLGPGGTVETSTILHVSTDEIEAPYTVGMVRLDDGPAVLSRIAGAVAAGAQVRMLADPDADAFWFVPATDAKTTARPQAA